ncbi:jg12525 [Pararge aegeria aegeria]|uniref:Jg12525 protein n=1 Tax=Pararge aegeria aegeria TaxID=348720 RepID=A0A8S4R5F7_9NEOP|nr:jg12525 [Pararge aegeria aegeria]
MECTWLKTSPSLKKGIEVINQLDESRFEQFLRRIVVKLKLQDSDIFTEEERSKNDQTEIEVTHQDLNSMFLQIEAIQSELDNLF